MIELKLGEAVVNTIFHQRKLLMRALFCDAAVVDNINAVHISHRRQAVSDDDGSTAFHELIERFLLDPLKGQVTSLQAALEQHRKEMHAQLEDLRAEIRGSRTDVQAPGWAVTLNGLSVRSMVFIVALAVGLASVAALAWRGKDDALVSIGDRAADAMTKALPVTPE